MAEKPLGNKERILFLRDYFLEHTDEQHPVTTDEIIFEFAEHGTKVNRKTVYDDIEVLKSCGLDLICEQIVRNGTKTNAWFVGRRLFEAAELKILVDAVSSAQFLTRQKTDRLIAKLIRLAPDSIRGDLVPAVQVAEHIKAGNDLTLYTLECISEAIHAHRKISFMYYEYDTNKQRVYRHNQEIYVLSPYATIWCEDRYYVVGWSDKREKVVSFRLDRMPVPTVLEEEAVPAPSTFNIRQYADRFTRMYGGREEKVIIRCRRHLMDKVIDKFGMGVVISNVTEDAFDATATVAVGGTFLSWLFQYAGGMYLRGPEEVKRMYEDMLHVTAADMEGDAFSEPEPRTWKL